ncbi:MAG: ABC transporter permease [Defluviitaleaceae bacterium]|nr:ABC transporter permease [Defluviitaleaceae bacterium]
MTDNLLLITNTLMYATPLILAGLGGVISEKSGVVNLALEGIMTIGAFAAAAVAFATGNVWLGFFAAGAAGAMLALLHALSTVTFKADQTISGVALNFVGPGLAIFFSRMFFGAVRSDPVQVRFPRLAAVFPSLADSVFNFSFMFIIAFLLVIAMYIFLYKTKWGLRIIAIGEHPAAADTLGVNVNLTRFLCVIASGVLAGFGGAAFTLSIVSIFAPNVIAGAGFIALAAVIFGKWSPHGLLGACLIFGFFQALAIRLRGYDLPVPLQVITIMPYILTIIILVLFVGKSVAPKAVGIPYKKGAH